MRYKKQIAIICLITFLLLPFHKSEEAKAFDLVITPSVILLGAALALSTGIVIANNDQLQEVGYRVIEGIKDIPGAIEDLGDRIKINALSDVMSTVIDICSTLPVDTIVSDYLTNQSILKGYANAYSIDLDYKYGSTNAYSFSVIPSDYVYYIICGWVSAAPSYLRFKLTPGVEYNVSVITNVASDGYVSFSVTIDGQTQVNTHISEQTYAKPRFVCLDVRRYDLQATYGDIIWDTPLDVDMTGVKDTYDKDKVSTYFPSNDGSISLPVDTPFPSNPSVPYDSPTSIPGIQLDSGVSTDIPGTDTGVVDKPNVDVGETPTTGEGLWDTLLSWLSSLFAPLVSLLSWIGDLLNSILDFLKSLVIPEEFNSLDFSPLYFSFANKFPFCIPFDLINIIKEFESEKKEPKFYVDMSAFSNNIAKTGDVGFEIDLTKFDELITIVRTMTLISFIFYIAFKTRDIIKG